MADGQHAFGFRDLPVSRLRPGEIVVDLFAGGGGASTALEQALQRPVDIAINHDRFAVGMHAANHPLTRHLREDIWQADPRALCAGRRVGWLHASPDCTHFSQAKGGQPRSRATRSLSWVVLKWCGQARPRCFSLENVVQILKWGPLVAKRDRDTGRVVKLDGTVAQRGERVPVEQQFLIPDRGHVGRTWGHFIAALRRLGYIVEWRALRACDFGAGTSRTRLFLIGRRDGEPIVWPAPTHGPRLKPYVTAADCIDWTIPCPSIFARKKPLADATCRRIARGIKRYVIDAAAPFIIPVTHQGGDRCYPESDPLPTITAAHRGELMAVQSVVAPLLTEHANASRAASWRADEPLRTQCAKVKGGHFALVSAFLEQANGGGPNGNPAPARAATGPLSSITGTGSQQRVVTAHMAKLRGTSNAANAVDPLSTISAGGEHHAVVECTLSPEAEAGALRVAAFLTTYYGNGDAVSLRDPLDTITTRDRLALVTVTIRGTPYVIVDIGLRMLKPHELYRAQGFPLDYIIDRIADGTPLTVTQQVRMVGNSVSPPPLRALAEANLEAVVPQAAVDILSARLAPARAEEQSEAWREIRGRKARHHAMHDFEEWIP